MSTQGHLAIVVGHIKSSGGAKGVSPINASEYEYNVDLANMIKHAGESHGQIINIFFRDKGGVVGAYQQVKEAVADACIELHFNGYNGTVQGTETWYLESGKEQETSVIKFAAIMQKHICNLFNRPLDAIGTNRGIKGAKEGDRAYHSLSQLKRFPCILIEPFFGDNAVDAQLAVNKKQELAEAIIVAFEEWLELLKN